MNIFITGATGFIGSSLIPHLVSTHQVTALVRNTAQAKKRLPTKVKLVDSLSSFSNFNDVDAVINLAGEPIFDHRWTPAQKQKLLTSRVALTQQLAQLINQSHTPPTVFISGSATGYYGDQGENTVNENTLPKNGFTTFLCKQWEAAAQQANTRVCLIRTGIVISPKGGALASMLPLYRFGLGGKLGNGQQYWPWIALEDMLQGILFLLENQSLQGAFNFTSPHPLPQGEINRLLGRQLKRPCFAHVPACILKLMLGERSQLLLDSQKVLPQALIDAGFVFQYPHFEQALKNALSK
ncbi:TIGR01777 family oxidoreductase [Pasteurella sp. PK-2025]|uniref:TIGR01777 family oxidoreductase n=1 Tax=Pasteurella sp. PK-2025 TaxID=3413133 RepID=UPI003C74AD32